MRINYKTLFLFFVGICCIVLYIAFSNENSLVFFCLFSAITLIIILDVLVSSYKDGCLIGFFSIANIFVFLIFVVRPIQILFSGNVNQFSVINRYSQYYGFLNMNDLPWAKAALIGLLGVVCLNIPFFSSENRHKFTVNVSADFRENYVFDKNQKTGIVLFSVLATFSAGLYLFKILRTNSLHIYDLFWVFLFSSIFVYVISRKRKVDIWIYIVIGLSIFLLSFRGRRQYAVNMLLCYICPLYFSGKNRKKTFMKVFIMFVAVFVVVFIFGNVRRNLRGAVLQDSFFEGILGEFSMFDMLLVSLKFVKEQNIGLFFGYNYLSIFTVPIPGVNIQPFDHRFTELIYLGRFHGGIPSSLFGSLFLNFSYVGVCVGSLLVGMLLSKIQRKLSQLSNYYSIGYYSIVTTFVYDLIRVGDFGRETWSLITFLLVYFVFSAIMKRVAKD